MHGAIVIIILVTISNGVLSTILDAVKPWDVTEESNLPRERRQDDFLLNIDNKWSRKLEEYGMKEEDTNRLSSKFMLELYHRLNLGQDLHQATGHRKSNDTMLNGDTVRSLSAKVNIQKLRRREISLAFNLSTVLNKGAVKLAELRIRPNHHIGKDHVNFYRISAILRAGKTTKRSHKFLVQTYMDDVSNFFCLNLTDVVLKWERHMNHGDTLEVTVLRPKMGRNKRSTESEQKLEITSNSEQTYVNNEDAILLVISEEGKLFRSQLNAAFRAADERKKVKRWTGIKKRKGRSKWKQAQRQKKQCKKYDFQIDFNAIGWGKWIIQPKVFNAHFCYGECSLPLSSYYNPTNHAMMQGLMMSKGTDQLGAPCCTPSKLRPLSMLYYEDSAIVVRHHEQMIVGECGCR